MKVGVIRCELGARSRVQASTVVSDQNFCPLEVYFFCISSEQALESAEGLSNYTDAPHTSRVLQSGCIPRNKGSEC